MMCVCVCVCVCVWSDDQRMICSSSTEADANHQVTVLFVSRMPHC